MTRRTTDAPSTRSETQGFEGNPVVDPKLYFAVVVQVANADARIERQIVVGRGELVAAERLAASGRLPVECVAVPARQTAAYVAVGDQLVASLAQQAQAPRGRAHPTGAAATRTAPPLRLVRRTTA